jgi:carbonic anhydrase
MSVTDQLLDNNVVYARSFDQGDLPAPPRLRVAVVACMDARLDVNRILGLEAGDAHVIRNAGGAVTDDTIRSLVISQRLLGTEEIILLHHTGCGMLTFKDEELKVQIEEETGIRPAFSMETFADVVADVRQSLRRVAQSPFIRKQASVRGFVYDVKTGRLEEIASAGASAEPRGIKEQM